MEGIVLQVRFLSFSQQQQKKQGRKGVSCENPKAASILFYTHNGGVGGRKYQHAAESDGKEGCGTNLCIMLASALRQ